MNTLITPAAHEASAMPCAGPSPDAGSPWTPDQFEAHLRALGARYHIHHPFNVRLNSRQCSPGQIRGWVANRFYILWSMLDAIEKAYP